VPETEGPVKATDQLNGREKMRDRSTVFWVGSGDAERVGSVTEREFNAERRNAFRVGLGVAERIGSGNEGEFAERREDQVKRMGQAEQKQNNR
jgi:hypothetical protein